MVPVDAGIDDIQSPSLTLGATQMGVILGTAAYMAPEQAVGGAVDRRADIWAFGVVLYEMLGGHPAFTGETASEVIAAVMMREIEWDRLPKDLPAPVLRLLKRCLVKDPRRRLRVIGEARLMIEDCLANPTAAEATLSPASPRAPAPRASRLPLVGAGALVVFAVERLPARQHLVQHDAERPDVRAPVQEVWGTTTLQGLTINGGTSSYIFPEVTGTTNNVLKLGADGRLAWSSDLLGAGSESTWSTTTDGAYIMTDIWVGSTASATAKLWLATSTGNLTITGNLTSANVTLASTTNWNTAYGIVTASSSKWDCAYGTVTASSSNWDLASTCGLITNASSSKWDTAYGWNVPTNYYSVKYGLIDKVIQK